MKVTKVTDFTKGWMFGFFNPSLHETREFEMAVKKYNAGDSEPAHYHEIATEWTMVISGKVSMNGQIFEKMDIIEVLPGEIVKFDVIEDAITTVVKIPCVQNDKYLV